MVLCLCLLRPWGAKEYPSLLFLLHPLLCCHPPLLCHPAVPLLAVHPPLLCCHPPLLCRPAVLLLAVHPPLLLCCRLGQELRQRVNSMRPAKGDGSDSDGGSTSASDDEDGEGMQGGAFSGQGAGRGFSTKAKAAALDLLEGGWVGRRDEVGAVGRGGARWGEAVLGAGCMLRWALLCRAQRARVPGITRFV